MVHASQVLTQNSHQTEVKPWGVEWVGFATVSGEKSARNQLWWCIHAELTGGRRRAERGERDVVLGGGFEGRMRKIGADMRIY